jgi:hypothetical protein
MVRIEVGDERLQLPGLLAKVARGSDRLGKTAFGQGAQRGDGEEAMGPKAHLAMEASRWACPPLADPDDDFPAKQFFGSSPESVPGKYEI